MTRHHTQIGKSGPSPATLVTPALGTLVALLAGCASPRQDRTGVPPPPKASAEARLAPSTLLQGLNLSGSSLPLLRDGIGFSVGCALAAPDGTRIVLDRFDRTEENVYEGERPAHEDEFYALVSPRLQPNFGQDLTFTNLFVSRAESCLSGAPGPVVVSMIGDAFSEGVGKSGHDAMRAAAERMARNPKLLAFFVVGASPAARAAIRQDLGPLGDRLRFKELTDDPASLVRPLAGGSL